MQLAICNNLQRLHHLQSVHLNQRLVSIVFLVEVGTKANGKIVDAMEKDILISALEMYTKANTRMERNLALEY